MGDCKSSVSRNCLRLLRVPPTVSSASGVGGTEKWDRLQPVNHIDQRSVHESGGCNCNVPFVGKQLILAGEPADGEADHLPKTCSELRSVGLRAVQRPDRPTRWLTSMRIGMEQSTVKETSAAGDQCGTAARRHRRGQARAGQGMTG